MAKTCVECGNCHLPGAPHNVDSWTYQQHFLNTHDRLPTLADAVAHCSDATRERFLPRVPSTIAVDEEYV